MPPEKIKHIQNIYLFLFLCLIAELLIVVTAILSFFLIGARTMLEEKVSEATGQILAINGIYKPINERNRQTNLELTNIALALKESDQNWSKLFYAIFTALPDDASLNYLSIQEGGERIELGGRAKTRQAFLELKDALQKMSILSDVNTPALNLAAKENIDFQFTAKLKQPD